MGLWIARSVAVFAAYAMTATAAAAHPVVDVANPQPNDRVTPGALVMQGVAFDPDAADGTGVDVVSVFMCSRERGGQVLGEAHLGMPAVVPMPLTQFAAAGWALMTAPLKGAGDERSLCVYAHSMVTDTETVVRIPITIGSRPPRHTDTVELVVPPPAAAGSPAPGLVAAGPGPVVAAPAGGGTTPGLPGDEGGPEEP
jgi:hypothetical protein